jgi:hypothetical protein
MCNTAGIDKRVKAKTKVTLLLSDINVEIGKSRISTCAKLIRFTSNVQVNQFLIPTTSYPDHKTDEALTQGKRQKLPGNA